MKMWIGLIAAVLSIGFIGTGDAHAAKADKKKDKKGGEVAGVIQKIEGTAPSLTLTIAGKGKKAANVTVTTNDKTAVTANGQAKTLSDLKVGAAVKISKAKGGDVSSIEVSAEAKAKKKKDAANPKKPVKNKKPK